MRFISLLAVVSGLGCVDWRFDRPPPIADASVEVDADETVGGAMLVTEQGPHDFADVTVDEESGSFPVVIRNSGDDSSGVLALSLTGHASDFEIAQTSDCIDAVLDPEETCTVPVRFRPGTAGPRAASLAVAATPGGVVTLDLTGNGLSPGNLGFTAGSALTFDTTEIDSQTGFQSVTVRNNGGTATAPLTVILGDSSNYYRMPGDTCQGASLGAGLACTVEARFNPTVVGALPAQLSVRESDTVGVSASLSGTGSARLGLTKNGSGTGTVVSTQSGINCGSGCASAEVAFTQSPITLTASVVPGQAFAGWGGACATAALNPVCSVGLTEPLNSVSATFESSNAIEVSAPSLSITENGSGSIGVTLRDMPAADVIVNVDSLDEAVATVTPATLTFAPENYNVSQSIVISAVVDDNATSDSTSIALTAAGAAAASVDVIASEAPPPTVPLLRKPINDTYRGSIAVAGSLRPSFVWAASSGGVGPITYRLQFSTDRTFATGVTSLMTSATSHQPSADLPVSIVAPVGARYYWRVSACVGQNCSTPSATWWVNLGRSDQDFNGDGYADAIVGAPRNDVAGTDAGRAYIYFGGTGATFNTTADGTLTGAAAGDFFGYSVESAGDVNGDGYADAVVGAYFNDAGGTDAGRAYVYLGGPGGTFDANPDGTLTGAAAGDAFSSVSSAGDINGDGYADVVVGATYNDVGGADAGRTYFYLGGAGASFDAVADATLTGAAAGAGFGQTVDSAGDVNADGYADVIVGAYGSGTDTGRAFIYLGGAGALDTTADGTLVGQAASDRFGAVASAGDVNADGFDDVIVGASQNDAAGTDAGRAYVYFGGAGATFEATADGTLTGEAATNQFGESVDSAGDVNGDGYDDIVVGADQNDAGGTDAGRAYVYFGGPGATFNTTVDGTFTGAATFDYFGVVASAGDVNADGYGDLVIGGFGIGAAGGAYVYLGGPGALDTIADGTLVGSGNEGLGTSVASVLDNACSGPRRSPPYPEGAMRSGCGAVAVVERPHSTNGPSQVCRFSFGTQPAAVWLNRSLGVPGLNLAGVLDGSASAAASVEPRPRRAGWRLRDRAGWCESGMWCALRGTGSGTSGGRPGQS